MNRHNKNQAIRNRLSQIIAASAVLCVLITLLMSACSKDDSYNTQDIKDYGVYSGHISNEDEGLRQSSLLAVFPDEIAEDWTVNDYYYACSEIGLDNTYQLLLDYTLPEDDFVREVARLKTLSASNGDETHTVVQDDSNFPYRAYVALFSKSGDYEYALIDESKRRIISVLSTGDMIRASTRFKEFLPEKDVEYEGSIDWYGFSIYLFEIDDKSAEIPDTLTIK
jgi:hypothetical protein